MCGFISLRDKVSYFPSLMLSAECLIQGRRLYFIQELCTGGTLLDNHEKEGEFSSIEVLLIMEYVLCGCYSCSLCMVSFLSSDMD